MAKDPLDGGELYVVIRRAVVDAIWDVIGTIAVLILALIVILVGLTMVSFGLRTTGTNALLAGSFGIVLVVLAGLGVAREFRLWPFR